MSRVSGPIRWWCLPLASGLATGVALAEQGVDDRAPLDSPNQGILGASQYA